MQKRVMLTGVTATGVLGYAIAYWLARASTWAEQIERDQYCSDPEPKVAAPATPVA